jgi:hypothetical protein
MMPGPSPSAQSRFAVCVCNDGYPAALELHRAYPMLPDAQAARHGLVRIVDESGEAYLYPQEFFRPVDLPVAAPRDLLRAS